MLVCVFYMHFARETAGAARTRLSLRPQGGGDSSKTRTQCAARSRMYVFVVPALSRDPYAAAVVLRDPVGRLLRNNPGLWLWVPAQGRDECVREDALTERCESVPELVATP